MTTVLCYPAISLDGFIAKSDGDSSWVTEEDERMFGEEVLRAGCVIVGRTTFEQYKGTLYPLPGATTFVCTSKPDAVQQPADAGVVYVGGTVDAILQQIQTAGFTSALLSSVEKPMAGLQKLEQLTRCS